MRLYLDVDGTVLRRSGHARLRGEFAPANSLARFLDWATTHFDCAWVSSRTRHGDDRDLRALLRQTIGPGEEWDHIAARIAGFSSPAWDHCKAEAMRLDEDFLWLDDAPEEDSLAALTQAGRHECWVPVAIEQRPDDLTRVMELIDKRRAKLAAA